MNLKLGGALNQLDIQACIYISDHFKCIYCKFSNFVIYILWPVELLFLHLLMSLINCSYLMSYIKYCYKCPLKPVAKFRIGF